MNIDDIIDIAGGLIHGWGPIGLAIVFGAVVLFLSFARYLFASVILAIIGIVRRISRLWAVVTRRTGDENELCPSLEPDYEWMHELYAISGVHRNCGYGKGHAGLCGRWRSTPRVDRADLVDIDRLFELDEKENGIA